MATVNYSIWFLGELSCSFKFNILTMSDISTKNIFLCKDGSGLP